MMKQGFLFDFSPDMRPRNFHATGPETEREAAEKHEKNRDGNCLIVLAMIVRNPGSTCDELWDAATDTERATLKELQEVRRRVTDLKAEGKVISCGARACRVKGNSMMIVRAV